MCELTDVTRWRAERSVRTIIADGMPLEAVTESSLLSRTIHCGIDDAGIDWTWSQEWALPVGLTPSPRQFAKDAVEKGASISEQQLDELFRTRRDATRARDDRWASDVDEAITYFICTDMFESSKRSDDWNIMFSRAYLHAFAREWESSGPDAKRFQELGKYIASHLYATVQFSALRRTLKKSHIAEDGTRLVAFWDDRIKEYDQWLSFAIDDGHEPEYLGAARMGDAEAFWTSINSTRQMPRIS